MYVRNREFNSDEPRVAALGGGTGLSTLLRGLKAYTGNITAVVTVADDGGGSGIIRQEFGILPPGDIRNCILALANAEPVMEQLLRYRFREGSLKGQNFGNLLIAALTDMSNGFENAIKRISSVLAVTGRVIPVTLENIHLTAMLEDGTIIHGESKIPEIQKEHGSPIKNIEITQPAARAVPEVLDAIYEADIIVLGPGSLYTSIIPHLLIAEVREAIQHAKAPKVYISNIMTQPGETTGYSLEDHINAINRHGGFDMIDYCIINNKMPPAEYLERYCEEGSEPVLYDTAALTQMGICAIEEDFLEISRGFIRHNAVKLARTVLNIIK